MFAKLRKFHRLYTVPQIPGLNVGIATKIGISPGAGEDVTKRSGFNYTDIVRDIAITDENDALALGLNEKHRAALSRSSRFNIESIRRIAGDGSLSYFTGASDSIRCAISLKEEFAKEPSGPVRIGIHNGEIYCTLNTAQLN